MLFVKETTVSSLVTPETNECLVSSSVMHWAEMLCYEMDCKIYLLAALGTDCIMDMLFIYLPFVRIQHYDFINNMSSHC